MALIKQLKDNQTSIYPVTHSQAVICNGTTLDQVIEDLRTGEGGISSETDPIFSASPAATITEQKKSEWDNKMDKVTLSKVATSGSYNDLTNKPTIPSVVTESTVSGWGFTKNTGTYSKPSGGIPKTDLASSVQTSLGKADTALQSYTEQYKGTITGVSANGTSVVTSGVADIPAASTSKYGVTKLSSSTSSTSTTLAATASAVKSAYDLANGKQDKLVSGTSIKTINGESILGSGNIEIEGGFSNANVQAVDTSDTLDDIETNTYVKYVAQTLTDSQKLQVRKNIGVIENFSDVATSGSYNDLIDKPTIPSAVTESTVSGWGFTKNTGTYSKPSGGIPKTDLASSVQTSLGKADTALQSYTEQYKGTITGVSANGTSVVTSGVADIPAASTSKYGVTKLSSSTSSTSTTLAATASAVKSAYDLANGKQDKLVSGTSIKTINGESILGSGDIEISGGQSVELMPTSGTIETMQPDVIYYTNTYNPNISIQDFETDDRDVRDYKLHFYIGETLPTITLPSYLMWANGEYPTFEVNTAYELAITSTVTYTSSSSSQIIYKAVCVPFRQDSIYG